MPNYRRGRINEEMSRELASILREIKDPRVSENFISITNVDVTPDLKYAKIGFSSMTGDKAEIKKGLVSASGFIRKRLAETLNLRITPELTFVRDNGIAHGAEIAAILHDLHEAEKAEATGAETEDGE